MPHCQKESHDHSTKSKKEKARIKAEKAAKKQAALDGLRKKEEEELLKPNNTPLVEGFGEYEIGCKPEREYKFNSKKRSKKHLRNDIRANERRQEEEEQKEKEEERRRHEQPEQSSSSEEEEPIVEEVLIYICECCKKKFGTSNQFINHSRSLKHRRNARPYEDVGVPVTGIEIKGEGYVDVDDDSDDDDDEGDDILGVLNEAGLALPGDEGEEEEEEEEESEEEPEVVQKPSMFAAFDDSSSSSSSSSSESENDEDDDDDDDDDEDGDKKLPADANPPLPPPASIAPEVSEDVVLQQMIDANSLLLESQSLGGTIAILPPPPAAPAPLDIDTSFDPADYDANTARDLSVLSRLQKRLAEKGIQPHQSLESYAENSISIGKTLLQKVMTAKHDNLEARLAAYNAHKKECQLLNREFALSKGVSKALPAQYARKQFVADDSRKRENIHHTGSHYVMAASRGMYHGRKKGLVARHSSQGARLQASRVQAKETQRMQTGGSMKVGKTGKKSKQKSSGQAGGSKKNGGEGGGDK
ncbi:hypothetical protein TrVE_jg1955 [Triparma verrucosa]|uniref:C2H2-type domain-containing protein n=1 Tax=Triparma verrucosa TaxID=1606542 RepID=A0A9W7BH86_9STRA|nr:hypothetical protein TrVE_jg1955 [Triparma verrucosa]